MAHHRAFGLRAPETKCKARPQAWCRPRLCRLQVESGLDVRTHPFAPYSRQRPGKTPVRTALSRPSLISLGAALRRRPFPDENRAGCPLTPDLLGRRRPLISRVLGAAPWALHCRLEHADQIRLSPCGSCGQPAGWVVGAQGGRGAGGDAGDRGDHPACGGVGRGQGRADLLCASPGPGQLGPAGAGGADLQDDDPLAAGHGRPAGRAGRDPGGDGGHQRLLEGGLLPAGSPRVRDLAGQRP